MARPTFMSAAMSDEQPDKSKSWASRGELYLGNEFLA